MQAVGSGAPARNSGAAQFAWSSTGTLALARGGAQPLSYASPIFVDRRGQTTEPWACATVTTRARAFLPTAAASP